MSPTLTWPSVDLLSGSLSPQHREQGFQFSAGWQCILTGEFDPVPQVSHQLKLACSPMKLGELTPDLD